MNVNQRPSSKFVGLCLAAILATTGFARALVTRPATDSPCALTAWSLYASARSEAFADFHKQIANCYNDPTHPFQACYHQAVQDRQAALQLAHQQRTERLDVCQDLGPAAYDPDLDPDEFSPVVNHPLFPLVPGRKLVYEKHTSEGTEHSEFTTLAQTVEVGGFECREVHDVVSLNGKVKEDTRDFFAQRDDGAVWYFGEVAQNYVDGFLDNLDGSWRTGNNGARPGIQMLAPPHLGNIYRQEFLASEAEDLAEIVALDQTVTVPAGTFLHCLKTEEFTPIEPDSEGFKYYAPGVGIVLEVNAQTGVRTELIMIVN